MIQLSCKIAELKQNLQVMVSMSSSGIDYVLNEHEVSEWVIKFNGLSGDKRHWGPYSPYKP